MYYQSGILHLNISDHSLVYTARKKVKIHKAFSYIRCRSYKTFDDKLFQLDVENIDWSELLATRDVNIAAELFLTNICNVVDTHAPYMEVKLHDNAPKWVNGDYLSHINEREYHDRNHSKCPCEHHHHLKIDSKCRTKLLKLTNYLRLQKLSKF